MRRLLRRVDALQRLVQIHQALARHRTLARDMAMLLRQLLQHRVFTRGAAGQRGVATLALHGQPAATAVGQQAGHTQTGARADQGDGSVGHRHATTDLLQIGRWQQRQRQRQRGEVIEHAQTCEAALGLQRGHRERPVVVGHAHLVTQHRVGDGDGTVWRRAPPDAGQVGGDRIRQAGVVGTGQHDDIADLGPRCGLPGKTRVRAADIGQQASIHGSVSPVESADTPGWAPVTFTLRRSFVQMRVTTCPALAAGGQPLGHRRNNDDGAP